MKFSTPRAITGTTCVPLLMGKECRQAKETFIPQEEEKGVTRDTTLDHHAAAEAVKSAA